MRKSACTFDDPLGRRKQRFHPGFRVSRTCEARSETHVSPAAHLHRGQQQAHEFALTSGARLREHLQQVKGHRVHADAVAFARWLLHPQTFGAGSGPQQPGFVSAPQHVCKTTESQHAGMPASNDCVRDVRSVIPSPSESRAREFRPRTSCDARAIAANVATITVNTVV